MNDLTAENIKEIAEIQDIDFVAFAGFNHLSKSEWQLMEELRKMAKAETFWDADNFYLKNNLHEAGAYMRKFSVSNWSMTPRKTDNEKDTYQKAFVNSKDKIQEEAKTIECACMT